jgi:hypothetical protein
VVSLTGGPAVQLQLAEAAGFGINGVGDVVSVTMDADAPARPCPRVDGIGLEGDRAQGYVVEDRAGRGAKYHDVAVRGVVDRNDVGTAGDNDGDTTDAARPQQ